MIPPSSYLCPSCYPERPSCYPEPVSDILPARPVAESKSEHTEIVLPNHANPFGNLLGGHVMHLCDLIAATAAMRHCHTAVATVSMDQMVFLNPVHIGELIILRASVNRAFRTSMEVGVKVLSENLFTGETKHTSSAYLTFVATDRDGKAIPVPPVIPESDEEKRRYEDACLRRERRLKSRAKC